ncbi:restriction endonuclease subunit S [Azotobacter armeniacus]
MTKKKETATAPKLRFPEFVGQAPREVQLCEVTAESRVRNGDGLPAKAVMGVSKVLGIVPMEERVVSLDITRYKVVKKNWFAYNPMRLNIGSIARWHGDADILVSPDYVVFRCLDEPESGIRPDYLDQFRQSAVWDAFVSEGGDGGVRVRIYYQDLARLEIALPARAEQQKIADCLTSLDELIAAQGQKVEALKTYTRILMQQLFPREGETLPRLRLSEFCDAPEWESTTLDALVDFQSGGTPSKANPAFWNGSIPWVSAKDMKRLFLDDSENHISASAVDVGAKVVPAGTVLMLTRGMTLLKDVPICVLRREMSFNQDVKALRPKDKTEGLFVALLLLGNKQRLLKMVDIAGHGTGKLNTDELKALELMTPKPAEQQRIAEFLSSLDVQIEAEAKKLAVLNIHKNGLMQQLFPSLEGTK